MARIISASRRTDIPRYFAAWFAQRRREGFARFRNAFGGSGEASLRNEDVLGYLFWTRDATPFAEQLQALRDDGVPYVFQFTINGFGRDVEPHTPSLARAIGNFRGVGDDLPSPVCIQWRYDPIVLSDTYTAAFHVQNFERIAKELAGATRVVNTSFVEPYLRAIRRLKDPTIQFRQIDPDRHKTAAARFPNLRAAGQAGHELLAELAEVARQHGMELRSCSNAEWSLPPSQCCSHEIFAPYGESFARRIAALAPGPSRTQCRCLATVDIGMDNTCVTGCEYCYVVTSHESAVKNFKCHRPESARLR